MIVCAAASEGVVRKRDGMWGVACSGEGRGEWFGGWRAAVAATGRGDLLGRWRGPPRMPDRAETPAGPVWGLSHRSVTLRYKTSPVLTPRQRPPPAASHHHHARVNGPFPPRARPSQPLLSCFAPTSSPSLASPGNKHG